MAGQLASDWFSLGNIPAFLAATANEKMAEKTTLTSTRENFPGKAKRGRPPSKPPTEELIRKRRKVF